MKTILEVYGLADLTDDKDELVELVEAEAVRCRDSGDLLGAGEWLVSELPYVGDQDASRLFAQAIALWASPLELRVLPVGMADLISKVDEFVKEELTTAFVTAVSRFRRQRPSSLLPEKSRDLAFRLSDWISKIFRVQARRPEDLCIAAAAQLENTKAELLASVDSFLGTGCANAKVASVEVVKHAHRVRELALAEERPSLGEVDILLGPLFRKFCESCERSDVEGILGRVTDIQNQAGQVLSKAGARNDSTLWNLVTSRVAAHISEIADEAIQRSRGQTTPSLRLSTSTFKIDLSRLGREVTFSSHLLNEGEGRASGVSFEADLSGLPIKMEIIEPKPLFDVGGHSEQFLKFGLTLREARARFDVPIKWKCRSATSHDHIFEEKIAFEQQRVQPDWDKLLLNPPYTTNPVKRKEELFGRDAILDRLKLNASAGASTFLWGQKRVGKTSLLQVLSEELGRIGGFVCILLRMGELGALHEGQLAYTIAERVTSQLPTGQVPVPQEPDFGAGLGKLVPFADKLSKRFQQLKFVIIIDGFEDLNPAFYTGERGRLFVQALRSLSEIGFTFFFVGSERMNAIYDMHSSDLNKWVNQFLDCIESREDRKALIIQPVKEAIEYESACVDFIVEYCGGNPFYMHLLCWEIFQRCFGDNRTYVSESDAQGLREAFIRSLGKTNFSHFWEDNPALDQREKSKETAENCLVFSCIASLGGSYESSDNLLAAQDSLGLGPSEQLAPREIAAGEERLRRRNILSLRSRDKKSSIQLPIFSDWLCQHAQLQLLPIWRDFCVKRSQETPLEPAFSPVLVEAAFSIPEDDLLAVSQKLLYLGKQKDVSELRVWLRQFDDDVRIEIAFLLLKRLAEKGYTPEGARLQALSKVEDAVLAKRKEIGGKAWTIVRGKADNLCMSYVDSEMKSGATTARELAKRLRPGKSGSAESITEWMKQHLDKDALIVFVDDFGGTGQTLIKGFKKFYEQLTSDRKLTRLLIQGRILCYLLYAFPEAVERLRGTYPRIQFLAANVFDEEVRALDENAGIFDNTNEINFAKDILLQIGRELYHQYPLGYGEMGALVAFHNTVPNNTLPIFWSSGTVNDKPWKPLFPRA